MNDAHDNASEKASARPRVSSRGEVVEMDE